MRQFLSTLPVSCPFVDDARPLSLSLFQFFFIRFFSSLAKGADNERFEKYSPAERRERRRSFSLHFVFFAFLCCPHSSALLFLDPLPPQSPIPPTLIVLRTTFSETCHVFYSSFEMRLWRKASKKIFYHVKMATPGKKISRAASKVCQKVSSHKYFLPHKYFSTYVHTCITTYEGNRAISSDFRNSLEYSLRLPAKARRAELHRDVISTS